jgi:hypothetical protein
MSLLPDQAGTEPHGKLASHLPGRLIARRRFGQTAKASAGGAVYRDAAGSGVVLAACSLRVVCSDGLDFMDWSGPGVLGCVAQEAPGMLVCGLWRSSRGGADGPFRLGAVARPENLFALRGSRSD